jgi:GDP-4-dehydro-6-deoxy-D-mannose reductase
MRALITGAAGFLGRHLVAHLTGAGATVFALSRRAQEPHPEGVERLYTGDVGDRAFIASALRDCEPTHVFHLAGVLGGRDVAPADLYENNVTATATFLDAVAATRPHPVVVLSSSSAVYGDAEELPIGENAAFRPRTDYAVSKIAQEMIALSRLLSDRLPVIRARAFNLIGPGQPTGLLASSIARQVVAAERGGERVIRLRSTRGQRDYVDVRDAARAYALLARHGTPGEIYNVCSAESHSVPDVVDAFLSRSRVPLEVIVDDPAPSGPDVAEQRGSYERLFRATQWEPQVPFERSVHDLLDDWRARMGH